MKHLYELTSQYHDALSDLSELDLDEDVIKDTLEGLEGDIKIKCQNVAAFIANRNYEIQNVKDAAKKLTERAASERRVVDRLVVYLKYNMESNGITDASRPDLIIKIKNKVSDLIIDDESMLVKFMVEKTTSSIDKRELRKALKSGEIKGAHLVPATRIEIK